MESTYERSGLRPEGNSSAKNQATKNSMLSAGGAPLTAVVNEDLASFLIVQQVIVGGYRTVSELQDYFTSAPEVAEMVEQTVARMEAAGMVRVTNGKIQRLVNNLDAGSNAVEFLRYLPNLFRLATKRVLKDEATRPEERKRRKEMVFWTAVPDDPKLSEKIREIELEYRAKIAALMPEGIETSGSSDVRFLGIVNCVLEPEDFA